MNDIMTIQLNFGLGLKNNPTWHLNHGNLHGLFFYQNTKKTKRNHREERMPNDGKDGQRVK